jgi:hypothetical protein
MISFKIKIFIFMFPYFYVFMFSMSFQSMIELMQLNKDDSILWSFESRNLWMNYLFNTSNQSTSNPIQSNERKILSPINNNINQNWYSDKISVVCMKAG